MNNPGFRPPVDVFDWQEPSAIEEDVRERLFGDTAHVPDSDVEPDEIRSEVAEVALRAAPVVRPFGLRLRSDAPVVIAGVCCTEDWPVFAVDRAAVPPGHVPPAAVAVARAPQVAYAFGLAEMVAATPYQVPMLLTAGADGEPLVTVRARDLARIAEGQLAPLPVRPADAARLIEWKRQQVRGAVMDNGCSNPVDPAVRLPCPWAEGWDREPTPLGALQVRVDVRCSGPLLWGFIEERGPEVGPEWRCDRIIDAPAEVGSCDVVTAEAIAGSPEKMVGGHPHSWRYIRTDLHFRRNRSA
jgi:hypothetical protein